MNESPGNEATGKCFDIPNIHESIAMDVVCGKMTIEEAACELNRLNYTPYVDTVRTQAMLAPYIEKISTEKGATK